MEVLSNKFTQFSSEVTEYTSKKLVTMQTSCDETVFELKEMKDYVDHFADNLVLNSQQITVDTYAGFSSKPITLTEVLRMCNGQFIDIAAISNKQDEKLVKVAADLDTKAPDTLVFNVSTLEKKVGTIELHIQKEEEQGIGALRKICEQLSVQMQGMIAEMTDKIDRESVGFIVHEKYEEIVRYLHEALQSSLEDERNFKEKADEIQEMVIMLSNSKADRTEIANMQEVMVKSEALLKKVGAQANLKDKIKDFVSRKELAELLQMKVDKIDFETQLQSAVVNTRKSRKAATLGTSLPPVSDSALGGGGGGMGGDYGGSYGASPLGFSGDRDVASPPNFGGAQGGVSSKLRNAVYGADGSLQPGPNGRANPQPQQPPRHANNSSGVREVAPIPVIALGLSV